MKTKFDYNDIVRVQVESASCLVERQGKQAWIVGIFTERPGGEYFSKFPPGSVYTIEFEDGSSVEIHENYLILVEANPRADT